MCNRLRQNSNIIDESRSLNTPSPSIIHHTDSNPRSEQNSPNDSSLSFGIPDLFNGTEFSVPADFPLVPNAYFEQRFQKADSDNQQLRRIIEGSFGRQNKTIKRLKSMLRQNQKEMAENKRMLQQNNVLLERVLLLLERQTPSNPPTTETISRFGPLEESAPSNNDSNSTVGLSIDERPTTSQGSSIERSTYNLIRDNLPSFSRPEETTELSTTTSALSKFNNQLLHSNTQEIQPRYPEKNRGKIPLSQWCFEIHVGTTDDVSALLAPTNPKTQLPNEGNPINYQLSQNIKTTITSNPSIPPKNQPMKIALLHPLEIKLPHQTDRHDTVLDCNGKTPELLVFGDNLPANLVVQVAAVSSSSTGQYLGAFYFNKRKDQYNHFYSHVKKNSGISPQRIKLADIELHKRRYGELQVGNTDTFKLTSYPSGNQVDTKIRNLQAFLREYEFKQIQLAFQIDGEILYSNLLEAQMGDPKQCSLKVSNPRFNQNVLSFDEDHQCSMKFTVEIPAPFHCTLPSGWKWIEVAVVCDGSVSPLYSIDMGDGERTNPNYMTVDQSSFELSLKIVKQVARDMRYEEEEMNVFEDLFEKQTDYSMPIDTPNGDIESLLNEWLPKFQIQFRLIHSENKPDCQSKRFRDECQPAFTHEFTEGIPGVSIPKGKTGQKRTSEVLSYDGNEMTTSKRCGRGEERQIVQLVIH